MMNEVSLAKVLVALDGSPRAQKVFDVGSEVAARFGARLYLVQVIHVPPEFPAAAAHGTGTRGDFLPGVLSDEALADLRKIADGVTVEEFVVVQGQPWRAILEAAERLDVDLIVIGSHGYTRVERMLGTTAALIANHSERNVLVVHDRPERARR